MSVTYSSDHSTRSIQALIADAPDDVVFVGDSRLNVEVHSSSLDRMRSVLRSTNAGLVYADSIEAARIDYQLGSLRDDFEFGGLIGISKSAASEAYDRHGEDLDLKWGGLYDLRLKLSIDRPIVRVPEPLYSASDPDERATGERQFDYVDPNRKDVQSEMERVATRHLERIGACLEPVRGRVDLEGDNFELLASIVIPVRNREKTVGDAVRSALSQKTDFEFNVIVVDNHSEDSTGRILQRIRDPRLNRIVPDRTDLGIGGCWNEAVYSEHCGRFAAQLDSDDLFRDPTVLARLVGAIREHRYAMLVGAYTTVNENLDEIPPGEVLHDEWTPENGPNNALRVHGFGAPRVYDVAVLRRFGFPNVSYGEDYAVALRVSRDFEIGRIFEPVYLCRRWAGNSDARLSTVTFNRYNAYKDWIRSIEIHGRIEKNGRVQATP